MKVLHENDSPISRKKYTNYTTPKTNKAASKLNYINTNSKINFESIKKSVNEMK